MKARLAALFVAVLVFTPFLNQGTNCLAAIDSTLGAGPALSAGAVSEPCQHQAHGPLVFSSLPTSVEPEPAKESKSETTGSAAAAVVKSALRFRGVPYRYAGMTSRGMDCSGLVSRVLQAHGIRAPHSSAALFQMGKPVRFEELRAGDLLFFVTRGRRVSHVGLYMGNGRFVHASSRSGGVITSSVYERYYSKRLAGARRLF